MDKGQMYQKVKEQIKELLGGTQLWFKPDSPTLPAAQGAAAGAASAAATAQPAKARRLGARHRIAIQHMAH